MSPKTPRNKRQLKKELKRAKLKGESSAIEMLVREEAMKRNPEILFPGNNIITEAVDAVMSHNYITPPRLTETSSIHLAARKYFLGKGSVEDMVDAAIVPFNIFYDVQPEPDMFTEEELNLDEHDLEVLVESRLRAPDKLTEFSNSTRNTLYGITKHLCKTYVDENGKPLKMDMKPHWTVEHSLHGLELLHKRIDLKAGTTYAILLHDWIEDAAPQLYRFRTTADMKEEGTNVRERTNTEIINKAIKDLYDKFSTGDDDHDRNLIVGIESAAVMTTSSYHDYVAYGESLTEEKKKRRHISPLSEEIARLNVSQNEIIESVLLAKLADKETAMMSLNPYIAIKRLKLAGKAHTILDVARDWINKKDLPDKYRESVLTMSTQLATTMYYTLMDEISLHADALLTEIYPQNNYSKQSENKIKLEIQNGLLAHLETGNEKDNRENKWYGGTYLESVVLGTKPELLHKQIPEMLYREDDDDESVRPFVSEWKAELEKKFPSYNIEEELSNRDRFTNLSPEEINKEATKLRRYIDRMYAFSRSVRQYAIDPTFHFAEDAR